MTSNRAGTWANLPLQAKGWIVLAIPLLALVGAAAAFLVSERQNQRAEALVAHSYQIKAAMASTYDSLLGASTGVREYLLTGKKAHLSPYESAIQNVPGTLGGLARLVQDYPAQADRMGRITSLAEQALDSLTLLRFSDAPWRTALPRQQALLLDNQHIMESLTGEFTAMRAEEDRLLALRIGKAERAHLWTLGTVVSTGVFGLIWGLLAITLFTNGVSRRIKRLEEDAGRLSEGLPLTASADGRDEIGRLSGALQRSSVLLVEREHALRAAKDEAEQANKAKSEFLSRMSHELRTPLNAILGFGQLLEMDSLTPEHRESVDHILKGGRHLLGLIDEILDITRVEMGRLAMSPEPVRISDALQDALDLVTPMATGRHVRFTNDREGLCQQHVRADRQRLKQVFLNLLSNAVKYNREGGTVTLSCEHVPPGRLRIKIADTGSGIPAEKMGRLFTPFDRLGAEYTEIEGSGLGLSLSKRLTEAMGGTLGVASAPGQGSTFWVEFPMAEAPAEQALAAGECPPDPAELATPRPGKVVLYIEDNLSNLKLIERLLVHRPSVKVLTATQARLGLQLAVQHRPDLILLDLQLPDMPGGEVLRALRQTAETQAIPVVVISADATPGQIQRLLAGGAQQYLTKPLDVRKFVAVLDEALKDRASDRARPTA